MRHQSQTGAVAYTKKLLSFLLLIISNSLLAQKNTAIQNHGWYIYTGNHRLNKKISLHTEYQWRRSEVISVWQQSLMRIGLDYYFTDDAFLTGGYGNIITYPYGKQPINHTFGEHRIWEQFVTKQRVGRFYLHHRYRLEQRIMQNFIKNGIGEYVADGFTLRNRARYRFMVTIPISQKIISKNTLFLGIYDEIFINFGKNIGANLFDQNRISITLGWQFTPEFNVQLGYLNQYIQKVSAFDMENNHTLHLWLTYNIDFRKLFAPKSDDQP